MDRIEHNFQYIYGMRPVFNKRALFSDGTKDYCFPQEPKAGDVVTIRFRTGKNNVDRVYLLHKETILMTFVFADKLFDYYEVKIPLGKEKFSYSFRIESGNLVCFYQKNGVTTERNPNRDFEILPGFSTPDWAKGAVMYQIFVDRFYNGDPANDVETNEYTYIDEPVEKVANWEEPVENMDIRRFYGGDLQGVMDKLDYLQDLGVEAIYFNPLFVSPSNHKYDIQDYDYIDPHFGKIVKDGPRNLTDIKVGNQGASRYICRVTDKENLEASNALFAKLTEEIHRRGMKVIIDGVFNHCGSFNKWMDREQIYENRPEYEKGAFVAKESPYHDFFQFTGGNWPYNDEFDGWWGHKTLPKLNYEESENLKQYILEIGKKWVSPPYSVDGWRLDVAADLGHSPEYNHEFWREFRREVKAANPNALILAEHYGNPKSWLEGDQWDTVMNYDAFMEPITWFLTGMEKHSDSYQSDKDGNGEFFVRAMEENMASYSTSSLYVAMNELSNHDHSRFLTRTNHKTGRISSLGAEEASRNINKGIFKEAVVMQMTWPGAPTIYYGDEAGLCGFTDPDNRRTYPWGKEDVELLDFHRDIIDIRKRNRVLKEGSLKFLDWGQGYLSYGRFDRENQMVIVINNTNQAAERKIPVWELGVGDWEKMVRILETTEESYNLMPEEIPVKGGYFRTIIPPFSGQIFRKI